MAGLKFVYRAVRGEFEEAMAENIRPISEAGTAAMREFAENAKQAGRRNIAAAGFSRRWQNTLRSEVFPKRGRTSANAAAWVYHRSPYAAVFEEGAQIRGRPLMWVPIGRTAKLMRRTKMTPRNFRMSIGPLASMRNTRKPLLGAKLAVTKGDARSGPPYKVTLSALKRGAKGQPGAGGLVTVPVFAGVRGVNVPSKFEIRRTIEREAAKLPDLYLKNLDPE